MDKKITENIWLNKFCKSIDNKSSLITVPVQTENWSKEDMCFSNVKTKVLESGGKIIYGWQIQKIVYEGKLVAMGTIPHAIWEDNEKNKICISPQSKTEILFFEDSNQIIENNELEMGIRGIIPNSNDVLYQKLKNQLKVSEMINYIEKSIKEYVLKQVVKQDSLFLVKFLDNKLSVTYDSQEIEIKDSYLIKIYKRKNQLLKLKSISVSNSLIKELERELNYKPNRIIELNNHE